MFDSMALTKDNCSQTPIVGAFGYMKREPGRLEMKAELGICNGLQKTQITRKQSC